eukprot:TRINITY_DN5453_c0_g1_i1.p1 TRINITY_DN5453_c0_g1~~TRINITY_DN5453_c0_g1_i1.p1  ORF type:complete len:308 (+),score=74.42 TRINITY_DN5453_c0_g1_i1:22-924(+)
MAAAYVQFGVSSPGDLHHAESALAACADPIKKNPKFTADSKIYFKIVPADTKDFLPEKAVENVNSLLDSLASVLSRAMDVFPENTVEPCIPSASVGFQSAADVHKVDFAHGQLSFAFLDTVAAPATPCLDFPNKMYSKVCMGGTFDRLHQGHKLLLIRAALSATDEAVVGVSAGDLVANKKWKEMLESFEVRQKNVTDFCILQRKDLKWRIFPLMDPGGPAVSEADLEAIVVSPEVAVVEGVKKINQTRLDAGMKPLDVLGIPLIKSPPSLRVFGSDDKISSTALRNRDKQRQEQAQHHT